MSIDADKHFSIIIPTFREAQNIPDLIKRIAAVNFSATLFEVIIVDDDSQDGLEAVVQTLQKDFPWLRLIVRRQVKSLSASALEGFAAARYPLLVLMDADLSHPPEKIPELIAALTQKDSDFVLGSRYVPGGSADESWPFLRRLSSRVSAALARTLLAMPIKDPLSGFFALRKSKLLEAQALYPIGWKLGLELMLKCRCKKIREIPIHFSQRLHGKSKLNGRVVWEYFLQVNGLLVYKLRRLSS